MINAYYEIIFAVSLILTIVYAKMFHKHFNVYFTMMFVFIPITNMGYIFLSQAVNLEEAILANKIIYFGGCFLPLFVMFTILELCGINMKKWIAIILITLSSIVYLSVLTIGKYEIFYKSVEYASENGTAYLTNKEYGMMHSVFIIMVLLYLIVPMFIMIYCLFVNYNVSTKMVILLLTLEFFSNICHFGSKKMIHNFELTPISYILAQIIFLIIIRKLCLYNITESGIDSIEMNGDIGFISFDNKLNYLGGSAIALIVFPELAHVKIDTPAIKYEEVNREIISRLNAYIESGDNDSFTRTMGNEIYRITITRLYDSRKCRGYQFLIRNDTKEQNYINLINRFNESLEKEVDLKTRRIVEMHDNLILSMATMVESRDNSTGGHIRRTSDVVRILIDEISKDNELHLSESFCHNIIKAAPMHDLGKIAVDDAILRKPGRFTPEEYSIMKSHAAEGGRIVHEILKSTDDEEFKVIAENVAHYHHERWDGSGYPEGLYGEEIPIEARIMAIADVYDALVSKRVYKEKMSFEEANKIIMEGMGKHFDKRLEKYYVAARPKLEEYYTEND
ncbi:putative two-component system response regulator [Eubacterium ruminantium]|nr:putative two-component system response regulator [Eubacterium ruminantium]